MLLSYSRERNAQQLFFFASSELFNEVTIVLWSRQNVAKEMVHYYLSIDFALDDVHRDKTLVK